MASTSLPRSLSLSLSLSLSVSLSLSLSLSTPVLRDFRVLALSRNGMCFHSLALHGMRVHVHVRVCSVHAFTPLITLSCVCLARYVGACFIVSLGTGVLVLRCSHLKDLNEQDKTVALRSSLVCVCLRDNVCVHVCRLCSACRRACMCRRACHSSWAVCC